MKNRKSVKRLKHVYAAFMTLGVLLCLILSGLSNVVDWVLFRQVEQVAEEETILEEEILAMKDTIMGDVYDRNGLPLVLTNTETGETTYRHDSAYSNTIGFNLKNKASHLLMELYSKDLFCADGGTDKGRNIFLTLDANVQEMAYNLINSGTQEKGSIVVLDAKTGGVVAMAYNPSFSIQEVMDIVEAGGTWDEEVLGGNPHLISPLNSPTRPGSIYKIITSIGILEQQYENVVIDDGGKGVWEQNGIKIKNANEAAYGPLTYYNGFRKSSNIYFGRMAHEYLGWELMREVSERCKVGVTQKYDFGRVASTFSSGLDPYDESSPNEDLAKAAYGYADIQLTSLHAAMFTQGIANQGVMCSPYMIDGIYKTYGYEVSEDEYKYYLGDEVSSVSSYSPTKDQTTKITTPEVAEKITQAMISVYQDKQRSSTIEGVTEQGLVVDGTTYSVALKTGTADLRENEDYNNIWMVSFAPVEDPQYVVVVNRYGVADKYGAYLFDDVMKMYRVLFE